MSRVMSASDCSNARCTSAIAVLPAGVGYLVEAYGAGDTAYRIPANACACTEPGKAPTATVPINRFDVRSLMPVAGVAVPRLSPVADSGLGRDHDQRYVLVDSAGQPIVSGKYVVTVTTP